jgi:hypothetical protein
MLLNDVRVSLGRTQVGGVRDPGLQAHKHVGGVCDPRLQAHKHVCTWVVSVTRGCRPTNTSVAYCLDAVCCTTSACQSR